MEHYGTSKKYPFFKLICVRNNTYMLIYIWVFLTFSHLNHLNNGVLLKFVSIPSGHIAELFQIHLAKLDVDDRARWEGGVVQIGAKQDKRHQEDQAVNHFTVEIQDPVSLFLASTDGNTSHWSQTHYGRSLVGVRGLG